MQLDSMYPYKHRLGMQIADQWQSICITKSKEEIMRDEGWKTPLDLLMTNENK